MMDLNELGKLTTRWSNEVGKHITDTPPEARFVTGSHKIDRQIYYFEKESGLILDVSTEGGPKIIKGYEIVDEEKFAWFVLKWL